MKATTSTAYTAWSLRITYADYVSESRYVQAINYTFLVLFSCPNLLVCVFEYFLNFTFPFAVDVLQVVASARSRNSRKTKKTIPLFILFYSGNLENNNEKRFNSKPSFRILYRLASIWPYSTIMVQGKVYVIPKHSCNFFLIQNCSVAFSCSLVAYCGEQSEIGNEHVA